MTRGRRVLTGLAWLGAAGLAAAHVRLIHPGNGKALRWGRPPFITIVFNQAGSPDIPDGSHLTALRNALAAWNGVDGTTLHVTEDERPTQMARTDWESDSVHLVLFDEDDSSGYFPSGTGIVAITPVWFYESGAITDADILFNGQDFQFTTSGQSGRFDVQDVAAHEMGHFVGLDHSGWAGATMYPYVDPSVILHRSLSEDERHGLRQSYPAQTFATIAGVARHASDDSAVAGAHVVARDAQGRTQASALSASNGVFTLSGLDPGTYTLYASPLDAPVSVANLGGGNTVETDFESTVFGDWAVAQGQALNIGNLFVETDVALGLGRNSDDYPLRAIAGQTRSFLVRGTGLAPGSTLTPSDPTLSVSSVTWAGTQVAFQVATPAGAAPGHVDLTVTNGAGQRSILPAVLEITPRDPSVDAVVPPQGNVRGGTQLTISGSRFQAGARVVLGPEVYVDGQDADVDVIDAGTIALTTRAGPPGVYDVVVIDPTGVEDRLVAGFQIASIPAVSAVFPAAGSAAGGTLVTISGAQFDPGCTVAIDGIVQAGVVRESASVLRLTTQAYAPGGPYVLEVTNPLGESAQAAFAFVAAADPVIDALDPALGTAAGGDEITVHGANFNTTSEVVFGADPETGAGGSVARSATFVDAGTLIVTTPRHASGASSILVRDASTGQAALQPAAFVFTSSGGGGGGCSVAPGGGGPADPREAAGSLAWLALTLGVLLLRAHRLRAVRAMLASHERAHDRVRHRGGRLSLGRGRRDHTRLPPAA